MSVSTAPAGAASPRKDSVEPVLQVRGLYTYFFTKYGTVRAVEGVTFSLYPGEVLGLVGESGSGKSVTALSILRLVPSPPGRILAGEVLFEGDDLLKLSDADMRSVRGRDITMILQDPLTSLNPVFPTGEQVAEPLRLHQRLEGSNLWNKVTQLFTRVRIPDAPERIKHYPHQFSGGMRQRVMASIAIACTPKILIADEPTTALDVTIQAQFLGLLRELRNEFKLSIIYITHDLGVVAQLCDRIAVMYAGRIVEIGSAERLFAAPAHPYTVGLIRSVPRIGEARERLYAVEGQPPDMSKEIVGCPFAPRCPKVMDICREQDPPEISLGEGEFARCWALA